MQIRRTQIASGIQRSQATANGLGIRQMVISDGRTDRS
jgi:hypothetical protein